MTAIRLAWLALFLAAVGISPACARAERIEHPPGSRYSVACWFDRALCVALNDAPVGLIYGYWLAKRGEKTSALAQLDRVGPLAVDSTSLNYHLEPAYCELQQYEGPAGRLSQLCPGASPIWAALSLVESGKMARPRCRQGVAGTAAGERKRQRGMDIDAELVRERAA